MTKRIRIENLRIKLPRGKRGQAPSVGSSIANDVARRIANAAQERTGNFQIDEVNIGRVPNLSSVAEHAEEKINGVLKARGRK